MDRKQVKLYFIAGMVPTDDERAEAARLGISSFRNGPVAARATFPESADVVAGMVPVGYVEMPGCKIIDRPKAEKSSK